MKKLATLIAGILGSASGEFVGTLHFGFSAPHSVQLTMAGLLL